MEPQKSSASDSGNPSGPKEFKTMAIPAKTQQAPQMLSVYPSNSFYAQQLYAPIVSVIISFWQNESNKKFYKNEVLNMKVTQLTDYTDLIRIKSHFPRCHTVNSQSLTFERLQHAEFFILRSTCDDDIHKAIKYGLWTSTNYTNHVLNNRFRECSKRNIPLFLIFT